MPEHSRIRVAESTPTRPAIRLTTRTAGTRRRTAIGPLPWGISECGKLCLRMGFGLAGNPSVSVEIAADSGECKPTVSGTHL